MCPLLDAVYIYSGVLVIWQYDCSNIIRYILTKCFYWISVQYLVYTLRVQRRVRVGWCADTHVKGFAVNSAHPATSNLWSGLLGKLHKKQVEEILKRPMKQSGWNFFGCFQQCFGSGSVSFVRIRIRIRKRWSGSGYQKKIVINSHTNQPTL